MALSPCDIEGTQVWLLGPLAVHPDHQRQGIGTTLIREGQSSLDGPSTIVLLGDPAYYQRHGFRPDTGIQPPYPLPPEWREAWQSIRTENAAPLTGTLSVPEYWRDPALWGP